MKKCKGFNSYYRDKILEIAIPVMAGIVANSHVETNPEDAAKDAVEYAKALLKTATEEATEYENEKA